MPKIIKQQFQIKYQYNILFTNNMFDIKNETLFKVIQTQKNKNKKIIIFIDKTVSKLHKDIHNKIIKYFIHFNINNNLVCQPILIPGGERLKNRYLYLKIFYKLIEQYKICRQSFIIAIGGGTIQDFLGYLASTAHRGVKLIRIPTTVLSQDDSGIGVKNGINYNNKKNFIGSFGVPYAVINDYSFLKTQKKSELIEGLSEAIKVALIKNNTLFNYIEKYTTELYNRQSKYIKYVIYKCAKLHASHISGYGDPFETLSSRPLDFGHWTAHKIESLSKYKISHGKAVAIGIIIDSTYSYFIGFLKRNDWKRIISVFIQLNFDIYPDELLIKKNQQAIFAGLEEFREHLGGKLTITLIKNIGDKIDMHHINKNIYNKVFMFLSRFKLRQINATK